MIIPSNFFSTSNGFKCRLIHRCQMSSAVEALKVNVVKRRPLLPKVKGSTPMMNGFCLWDFSTITEGVLVMSPGSRH